jgi:hypothetical protein
MEPTTLAPPRKKPAAWWMLITFAAGVAGALAGIAAGGTGTYDVAPFKMELRAWPTAAGETQFAVEAAGLTPGRASAGTHRSPIGFRATITGVSVAGLDPTALIGSDDGESLRDPRVFAQFLGQNAKSAARAFGIKVALLAIGGAAIGGLGVALAGMRFGRIAGAVLAGVLTIGIIGLLVQQTYDPEQFRKTCWQQENSTSCTQIAPS